MGNKTWKNIEQSNAFRKIKLKLRQYVGIEPKFKKDIDIPTVHYSGWNVVPSLLNEKSIVYSIGICDDIDFEKNIISLHQTSVFAFDPTPYSIDWIKRQELPEGFNFYPWAASETDGTYFLYPRINKRGEKSSVMFTFHEEEDLRRDGVEVEAYSLNSMVRKLGHTSVDVLKMDVEGAEYGVLDSMLKSKLRPKMLLIEFHHRFKGLGKEKTCNAVTDLRNNGYLIADISETGREFCFIKKSEIKI